MRLTPTINMAHLDHLSTRIVVDGEELLATHIYADAPGYEPIGDPDEGIACVDDVARAAVVYLDEHARTGSPHALDQARAALNFTLRMQEPDGRFTNFITDLQGTINRTGETSKPDLGWWAFRGMWALARGYGEFAQTDAAYAARLLGAYQRTERALTDAIALEGGVRVQNRGRSIPAWTLRIPPDQAALAAIAVAQMQETRPSEATGRLLGTLAEGVRDVQVQRGVDGAFTHVAQTTGTPETWHAWGAHAGEALARAGIVLGRGDLITAARAEVEGLLAWQLAAGRIHELAPGPQRAGQQVYGVAVAVRAAMSLYRATGEERYAQMAGAHASWLAGNNMADQPMYDAPTGRVFDGIDGAPRGVNRSSGAESTIEGLMVLQAIAGTPEAERIARMRPVGPPLTWSNVQLPTTEFASGSRTVTRIEVPADGEYVLLAGRVRGLASPRGTDLAISIDGIRAATLGARVGTDTSHTALDRLTGSPIRLTAGTHDLVIDATGDRGAAPARVQSLTLHPATSRTTIADEDGATMSFAYAIDEGHLDITRRRATPWTATRASSPD